MKKILLIAFASIGIAWTEADIWQIDFTSGGMSPTEETPPIPPSSSTADGGELSDFGGAGITYDDAANVFNINIGYGSDPGYGVGSDLTGNFTLAHIHEGAPGVAGLTIVDLTAMNNPAGGSNLRTGTITGSTGFDPLSAAEETALFAGNLYINIHSATFPNGELRGQLTAIPEPRHYATLAGLGLLGLGLLRRFKLGHAL